MALSGDIMYHVRRGFEPQNLGEDEPKLTITTSSGGSKLTA